jgi:hypothetical protein
MQRSGLPCRRSAISPNSTSSSGNISIGACPTGASSPARRRRRSMRRARQVPARRALGLRGAHAGGDEKRRLAQLCGLAGARRDSRRRRGFSAAEGDRTALGTGAGWTGLPARDEFLLRAHLQPVTATPASNSLPPCAKVRDSVERFRSLPVASDGFALSAARRNASAQHAASASASRTAPRRLAPAYLGDA